MKEREWPEAGKLERDPHEVADDLGRLAVKLAEAGRYDDASLVREACDWLDHFAEGQP